MESSLSFLVKDRHLDKTKRRWIKSNIRKRECVAYVPWDDGYALVTTESPGASEDSEQLTPCRCGRLKSEHVKLGPCITSRDYRRFSEDFPTDVYLEVVNTAFNKERPITYAPKQVIRLAADLEIEVLRQLIGSIWRMPKANFMVSLFGTCENKQASLLQDNLSSFFAALANPGNVMVTMCTRDPFLRTLALSACELKPERLHPASEIVPIVFAEWGKLTAQQREVLLQATKRESSAEDEEITTKVPVLASHKGYFLLTDYGVQSLPDAVTETTTRLAPTAQEEDTRIAFASGSPDNLHRQHTPDNKDAQSPGHQSTEVNRDSQSSSLESGEGRNPIRPGSEITTSTYSSSMEAGRPNFISLQSSEPQTAIPIGTVEAANWSHPDELSPIGYDQRSEVGGQNKKDDRMPYPAPYPPLPTREGRCAGQSLASRSTDGQSDPLPDSSRYPGRVSELPTPYERVRDARSQDPPPCPPFPSGDERRQHMEGVRDDHSVQRRVISGQPVTAEPFSFTFPSPLRRVVETVLQEHSRDPGGQGSLMVVSGCPTFLDLASIHGAVVSGVPVVIIKSSNEEQSVLLQMLEELDQPTGSSGDEHGPEKRPGMVDEVTLTRLGVKKRIQHLKDFKRYQHQAERVVRDLLLRRHLLTVCDLGPADNVIADQDVRLLHAAVEAFMKAMPKEEATTFFRKHTLRLAGDRDDHPVKQAQREFQKATLAAAVTHNRPDLLDIIVKHGFVTEDDVFPHYFNWETMEQKDMDRFKAIPFKEMKYFKCSELRERFVERVCDSEKNKYREIPTVQKLFLFAVINGRTTMAKHFWKRDVFPDQVANALIASHVSSYLAESFSEDRQALKNVFTQQAVEFANLAKGTLNDCYVHDPKKACDIVTKTADGFAISPIEAAIFFNIRAFIAEPAVATFLNLVWKGQGTEETVSSLPSDSDESTKCTQKSCAVFWTAPRTKCFITTLFYIAFLTLFGHTLIFETRGNKLSPFDITLLVWAGSFLVEEFMQCMSSNTFLKARDRRRVTLRGKITTHFSDVWNILDFAALFLFALGYVLRVTVEPHEVGHVMLSLTYILFFLRLLRFLTLSRSIGPMLPMIVKMLGDLIPFLVILSVFVFAYGVASEALLHPGTSWHPLYLLYLPRVAFWPIFGEYGFDTIDGAGCSNNSQWYAEDDADVTCPSRAGRHVVPVLLGLYILISNVLMLNLVIAKFNHSFEEVHNESKVWWAWLRSGLIEEYYGCSALPPPLTLLYRALQILQQVGKGVSFVVRFCCCYCYRCCHLQRSVFGAGGHGDDDEIYASYRLSGPGERGNDTLLQTSGMRRMISRMDVEGLFSQEANVFDILELDEFRFSDTGTRTERESDTLLQSSAPQDSFGSITKELRELRLFEAWKASAYVLAQDSIDHQPLATRSAPGGMQREADLQSVLARLEKKIEDTRDRLQALDGILQKAASAASSPVSDDVTLPETARWQERELNG